MHVHRGVNLNFAFNLSFSLSISILVIWSFARKSFVANIKNFLLIKVRTAQYFFLKALFNFRMTARKAPRKHDLLMFNKKKVNIMYFS